MRAASQPTHLKVLETITGGYVNVASIWTLSTEPLVTRMTRNVPAPVPVPLSVNHSWRLTTYSVPLVLDPVPCGPAS